MIYFAYGTDGAEASGGVRSKEQALPSNAYIGDFGYYKQQT
jgi:hypothetical protein